MPKKPTSHDRYVDQQRREHDDWQKIRDDLHARLDDALDAVEEVAPLPVVGERASLDHVAGAMSRLTEITDYEHFFEGQHLRMQRRLADIAATRRIMEKLSADEHPES